MRNYLIPRYKTLSIKSLSVLEEALVEYCFEKLLEIKKFKIKS